MKNKHTAGKCPIHKNQDLDVTELEGVGQYEVSCLICRREHAHLIAAAPDMLKALKIVYQYANKHNSNVSGHIEAYKIAKNAIAKAEGKERSRPMSDKHTGTPWEVVETTDPETTKKLIYITSDEAETGDICDLYHSHSEPLRHYLKTNAQANAERIVACVNALDGISNEALESGVVGEMKALIQYVSDMITHGDLDSDAKDILNKLEGK